MTPIVRLEAATRQQRRAWSALAFGSLGGAVALAVAAGGPTVWLRLLLGAVAIHGCYEAIAIRRSLTPMVVAAALMLAIVPIGALVDRTVVSALGASLLLVASESAHVARRLATAAPVATTRPEAAALIRLVVLVAAGLAVTVLVAQVDRWAAAPLAAGSLLSAAAVAWWIRSRP